MCATKSPPHLVTHVYSISSVFNLHPVQQVLSSTSAARLEWLLKAYNQSNANMHLRLTDMHSSD